MDFRAEVCQPRRPPYLYERWLHEKIRNNPSLLGLEDLQVRESDRSQPNGGRYYIHVRASILVRGSRLHSMKISIAKSISRVWTSYRTSTTSSVCEFGSLILTRVVQ